MTNHYPESKILKNHLDFFCKSATKQIQQLYSAYFAKHLYCVVKTKAWTVNGCRKLQLLIKFFCIYATIAFMQIGLFCHYLLDHNQN